MQPCPPVGPQDIKLMHAYIHTYLLSCLLCTLRACLTPVCLLQQATTRVALVSWAWVAPSLLRVVDQPTIKAVDQPTIKAVDSAVHRLVDRMVDRQPSLHLGHHLQAQLALLLERVGPLLAANNTQHLK